jgi:hypothetical protein
MKIHLATAVLATIWFTTLTPIQAATTTFYGPLEYTGFSDSPFLDTNGGPFSTSDVGSTFFLEDFEDGNLATGVSAFAPPVGTWSAVCTTGQVVDGKNCGTADSVEGGSSGYTYHVSSMGDASVTFSFDASILGFSPNYVGVVWTDGSPQPVTFEAFDLAGNSLGMTGGSFTDSKYRFFGVATDVGISAIRLSAALPGGLEADHLQWGYVAPPPEKGVAILSPAMLWLGLKNGDDQGTAFDLKTEVYINDTLISDGITRCIAGVTRNPNRAREVAVPFGPITAHGVEAGDLLSLRVLTRIGTNPDDSKCPGHRNAVGLRLYYDAVNRPSRFGAEIAPSPLTELFLHADGGTFLDDTAPTATNATFQDSSSLKFSGGNLWKEIGTWIMTIP